MLKVVKNVLMLSIYTHQSKPYKAEIILMPPPYLFLKILPIFRLLIIFLLKTAVAKLYHHLL